MTEATVSGRGQQEDILYRRIKMLILLRLVVVTAVLIGGLFFLQLHFLPLFSVIAAFYFCTVIYAYLLKYSSISLPLLAYIQIAVDVLLETFIIHYTGGVDSIYAFLYVPTIVLGGVIISEYAAKFFAGLASMCYGMLCYLEYTGLVKPVIYNVSTYYNVDIWTVIFIVSFRMFIYSLVGYLSSYLARSFYLQRTEYNKLRKLTDLVLNNVLIGIALVDKDGKIVYVNPYLTERFPGRDLIDKSWITAFNLREEDKWDIRTPAGKRVVQDGRIINYNYYELKDEKGEVFGGIVMGRDITEIVELENRLREQERMNLTGELAIAVAHELRNPLTSLRGAVEVLKSRERIEEENREFAEIILKESDRLNQIIEGFLAYGRSGELAPKLLDLEKIIDDVWTLLSSKSRDIFLEKEISTEKPSVFMEEEAIRQVLYNILLNSMEALPDGGRIYIRIWKEQNGEVVKMDIEDTGRGIPVELISPILEGRYSSKQSGMGIGISIVKRILERFGGEIRFIPKGQKTAFIRLVLPGRRERATES